MNLVKNFPILKLGYHRSRTLKFDRLLSFFREDFKAIAPSSALNKFKLYCRPGWAQNYTSNLCFKRHFTNMDSQHTLPLDTPIIYLKCEEAFSGLTENERKFAHYLSRASWWGGLIIFCQKSPESPILFNMLTRLFRSQPLTSLKEVAMEKAAFSEDDFKGLLIYYSGLVYNSGNFLGFGDRKFIPVVEKEKLEKLIRSSKAYLEASDIMDTYLNGCLDAAYDLSETKKFLGLPEQGVTMYFTPNCTADDAAIVKEYLSSKNIEAWNTRLLKYEKNGETILDIRIASIENSSAEGITVATEEFQGHKICVSRGDYAFALRQMIKELEQAKAYANDLEVKMLDRYIESFTTGSVKSHKEGSAHWVKNKSPAVETYMGFIEVYTDPTNQRAEFESFVAVVNREQSRKFDLLVSKAEKEFLPLLPWGSDFEDDVFMQPDFSSLDVVTFATAGLPIGINIPNYKDVKEEIGFKNVTLSNVMSCRSIIKGGPFISDADHVLREKHGVVGLDIQVGLHELLGHGCGKFLRRKEDGTLNFDPAKVKNPFTGGEASFYEKGQTFNTVFTDLSSSYEECRAENVALYLSLNDDILDIFGVKPEDKDDMKYVIWLDMFYAGLKGLEMYQPDQKKWGQAHSRARFVLLRVALEAGNGLVTLTETVGEDGLPDLLLTVDRSKIATVGREAMGDFLKKLQVYRSMGDIESARGMFEKYSQVLEDGPQPFAKWQKIVVRKRRPRMILTMANTRESGGQVELISYPDGPEGNVASWIDRFSPDDYNRIEADLLNFANNYTK
ncbi:UNVERIFIED_CONTAM: hypothetical protein GTU68_000126 [Idotea baltica]|nr:hypothetical protein [Idotea baltica]